MAAPGVLPRANLRLPSDSAGAPLRSAGRSRSRGTPGNPAPQPTTTPVRRAPPAPPRSREPVPSLTVAVLGPAGPVPPCFPQPVPFPTAAAVGRRVSGARA
ncbi:hypothetical protein JCM9533A_18490 [Catenuloplanes niger JCM 9533]